MRPRGLFFALVLLAAAPASAQGTVSALVKFSNVPSVVKLEILQNATVYDVTANWYACGAAFCAVVPQPLTVGLYNYSVRVTDGFGRVGVSNVIPFSVPNAPAPTAGGVSVVLTTGTPTPGPTQTPTP